MTTKNAPKRKIHKNRAPDSGRKDKKVKTKTPKYEVKVTINPNKKDSGWVFWL